MNQSPQKISRTKWWLAPLLIGPWWGLCASAVGHETFDVPRQDVREAPVSLTKWLLAGPFVVKDESCAATSALHAGLFPVGGLQAVGTTRLRPFTAENVIDFRYSLDSWSIDASVADGPATACFAAVLLESDKPRRVFGAIGSDDEFQLWLNGQAVYGWKGRRTLKSAEDIVALDLHAGGNQLIVKVVNRNGWTGFSMRLEPTVDLAIQTKFQGDFGRFLASAVVERVEDLRLELAHGLYGQEVSGPIREGEAVVGTILWREGERHAPELRGKIPARGVLRIEAEIAGTPVAETIIVGDPGQVTSGLVGRVRRYPLDADQDLAVTALERRLKILLAPENMLPGQLEWCRKIVHAAEELIGMQEAMAAGRDPLRDIPGLHYRGFYSAVDGQPQFYRVFWPKNAAGKRPLFMLMPTPLSANRPFIASTFAAKHLEAERLAELAESLQVAFLWPGYGCLPYGNPGDFAHFDAVLAHVQKLNSIDLEKIYPIGTCAGGMLALMSARRWPDRFAGVGILDGIYGRPTHRFDGDSGFGQVPAYRDWIAATSPSPAILHESSIPLRIVYDGAEPGHGDLWNTERFLLEAQAAGVKPAFANIPQEFAYHVDGWRKIMTGLLSGRRRDWAGSKRPPAADRSVASALAEPFVVVMPTAGSGEEQAGAKRLADAFLNAWKNSHFGPCRLVADSELRPEQERDYNLVLLGNRAVNTAWRRLARDLPVVVESDGIGLRDRHWAGSGLTVQAVFPHPHYPARKVVVVGAGDLQRAGAGTMDLSIDGWFEYAVWNWKDNSAGLVEAGEFPESAWIRSQP